MRKMDEEESRRHHPYCVFLYENIIGPWSCSCWTFSEYDKWRKDKAKKASICANCKKMEKEARDVDSSGKTS